MPDMHLAELNIGGVRYPLDDPRMAEFVDNLALVNGLAERSDGFVWRLKDASGGCRSSSAAGRVISPSAGKAWRRHSCGRPAGVREQASRQRSAMKLHEQKEPLDIKNSDLSGSVLDDVNMSGSTIHNIKLSGASIDDGNMSGWRVSQPLRLAADQGQSGRSFDQRIPLRPHDDRRRGGHRHDRGLQGGACAAKRGMNEA
jgi:uncharacterized protein DUF3291